MEKVTKRILYVPILLSPIVKLCTLKIELCPCISYISKRCDTTVKCTSFLELISLLSVFESTSVGFVSLHLCNFSKSL